MKLGQFISGVGIAMTMKLASSVDGKTHILSRNCSFIIEVNDERCVSPWNCIDVVWLIPFLVGETHLSSLKTIEPYIW